MPVLSSVALQSSGCNARVDSLDAPAAFVSRHKGKPGNKHDLATPGHKQTGMAGRRASRSSRETPMTLRTTGNVFSSIITKTTLLSSCDSAPLIKDGVKITCPSRGLRALSEWPQALNSCSGGGAVCRSSVKSEKCCSCQSGPTCPTRTTQRERRRRKREER
ncbi:hypothetical protein WMY93_010549 [Mugilogobius chulae]|uniref:Uncharacterized protein n=1 Tax=Mugilogobius chulae TaxID=88201 RepID=A0AAW0P802_9GOBI